MCAVEGHEGSECQSSSLVPIFGMVPIHLTQLSISEFSITHDVEVCQNSHTSSQISTTMAVNGLPITTYYLAIGN